METRLLKYALEIGRLRSFTKAAASLQLAQPSLSQQIGKLEQEIGFPLFDRGHRSVIPTPDGLYFLEKAQAIVQMHEDLERELRERSEGIGSELTIGAPAITGEHILPPLLEAFKVRYPTVRVQIIEDSPKTLEEWTAKGVTDLAVLPLPVEDSRLSSRTLLTEPILLAIPPRKKDWMVYWNLEGCWQEAERKHLSLSCLGDAPFIVLKPGYSFRQTVLELCAESGFQPQVAYETSSIEMAQSLVAHGLGVTLLPAMVQRLGVRQVPRYFALQECPSRTLVFVYRKGRYLSLSARAFMELATTSEALRLFGDSG